MAKPHWLRLAFSRCVVLRATACAAIVGSVLIVINHYDCCILRGEFDVGCLGKSLLMPIVPYVVSTVSSVHALLQEHQQ